MKKEKTIQIPVSIVEENLTTSEIGAIVVLMASPYLSWSSKQLWQVDKTFSKELLNLQHQKIVNQDEQGNITVSFGTQGNDEEPVARQSSSEESVPEQAQ